MDKIYTKEKMIDLYLTAPVSRITISIKKKQDSSKNIYNSCSQEPMAKRIKMDDDSMSEDIMSDDTLYTEEPLNTVLSREIPFMPPQTPIRKTAFKTDIESVSPYTRNIISLLSKEDAVKYVADYLKENKTAKRIQDDIDSNDPEFTYTLASEVGIFLEYWVCVNIKCPICMGELHKYILTNMPVIDVKCSNEKHTFNMGPKYFQIKASDEDSALLYFTLNSFFDQEHGFITVGSRNPGNFSHRVKPSEAIQIRHEDDKKLLIGYICIEYKYYSANKRYIKLNLHKSFILLPKLKIASKILINNDYYYKYIQTITGKPTIIYNPEFVQMRRFESLTDDLLKKVLNSKKQIIINLDTIYEETLQKPENMGIGAAHKAASEEDDPVRRNIFDLTDPLTDHLTHKLKYLILKDII
jgi:hypothetical protein